MTQPASAYPLTWPEGWPRTPNYQRRRSRYKISEAACTEHLLDQLRMFGAARSAVIISSNVALRRDGQPYANQPRSSYDDPGVAVYWSTRAFKDRVIACDKWQSVYDNIHAIGLAVAAMRAIDRAGATQMLEIAFNAFGALPSAQGAAVKRPWWEVFSVPQSALDAFDVTMLDARYRELARKAHPDLNGGNDAAMVELNAARAEMHAHYAKR